MKALKIIVIVVLALTLAAFSFMKFSGVSPISFNWHKSVYTGSEYAIDGFDPVAYFTENKATKGKQEYQLEYDGATWLFTSEENKQLFNNSPENYKPVCGGHCSFAVSKGFVAPGNPESWSIENGKLYFFSDQSVKEEVLGNLAEVNNGIEANWK